MSRNFYFLAFAFIMILFLPVTLNQRAMVKANDLKIDYNEAVDNAASDAAKALLIADTNDSHEVIENGNKEDFQETDLNLNAGLNRFYRSLYLNLGIQRDTSQQQTLFNKLPIIVAAGYDGYYIHTWQEIKINGKTKIVNDWTDEKKYLLYDKKDNIKINYTLGDYVYIEDMTTKQQYEGNRQKFAGKYPDYFGDAHFNNIRSQIINQMIQNDLDVYTYSNNAIAKKNGWQIQFNTPLWGDRAITTISFVAFIQGKLTIGAPEVYNSYGFGTAKVVRKKQIYGYERDRIKMYSTEKNGTDLKFFYSSSQAAEAGYIPDPKVQ